MKNFFKGDNDDDVNEEDVEEEKDDDEDDADEDKFDPGEWLPLYSFFTRGMVPKDAEKGKNAGDDEKAKNAEEKKDADADAENKKDAVIVNVKPADDAEAKDNAM